MNITQGKRARTPEHEGKVFNDARRLYDRLRKRSYRNIDAQPSSIAWAARRHIHRAYVKGVRDTINELLEGVR